jgi:hypothetical protein
MANLVDLHGRQMGDWTVVGRAPRPVTVDPRKTNAYWQCRCVCGREKAVDGWNLRYGRSVRCSSCAQKKVVQSRKLNSVPQDHATRDRKSVTACSGY